MSQGGKILAEVAANHNGDRGLMREMVEAAAKAGADVVKFQSFRADTLSPSWPDYDRAKAYYAQRELSLDDHLWLMGLCQQNGVEFLTTVFDVETAKALRELPLLRIKVGSADMTSWDLLTVCLEQWEHVIISTGMHTLDEVRLLQGFLGGEAARCTILHCVSLYPTPPESVNMLRMNLLSRMFPAVGFSDHTLGTDAAKLALSLGAACVEKHFTTDRNLPGKDQAISKTPEEIAEIVRFRNAVGTMMFAQSRRECDDLEARRYIGRFSGA